MASYHKPGNKKFFNCKENHNYVYFWNNPSQSRGEDMFSYRQRINEMPFKFIMSVLPADSHFLAKWDQYRRVLLYKRKVLRVQGKP